MTLNIFLKKVLDKTSYSLLVSWGFLVLKLTVSVLIGDLALSLSGDDPPALDFGSLTLIILLMYASARLVVLKVRWSSNPSILVLFLLFPGIRISHILPSFIEPVLDWFRPSSMAEFLRFLPWRSEPTPPPPFSAPEFLRRLPFEPVLTVGTGLGRDWVPDSEAERIRSDPVFKLVGKSLNHFAMLNTHRCPRHSPYTRATPLGIIGF